MSRFLDFMLCGLAVSQTIILFAACSREGKAPPPSQESVKPPAPLPDVPDLHIAGYGRPGTQANQVAILHDDARGVTCYAVVKGLGGYEGLSCVKDLP